MVYGGDMFGGHAGDIGVDGMIGTCGQGTGGNGDGKGTGKGEWYGHVCTFGA